MNIFNHARLIEHGSISKGCLHIVTPPSEIKKKGSPTAAPPPSSPPPPSGDTRTESYLKLAAGRRAGGSSGTVSIDPNSLVQGQGQVAIQGGGSVVYNQAPQQTQAPQPTQTRVQQPSPFNQNEAAVSRGTLLASQGHNPYQMSYGGEVIVTAQRDPFTRQLTYNAAPPRQSVHPPPREPTRSEYVESIAVGGGKLGLRGARKVMPLLNVADKITGYNSNRKLDTDENRFVEFSTGPINEFGIPTLKGYAKIAVSESPYNRISQRFTAFSEGEYTDFNPGTRALRVREQRANLVLYDSDVQTAVVTSGFLALSAAGPIGAGAARGVGLASGAVESYGGFMSKDATKLGSGVFLFATSRPLAAFKRPFIEAIGTKVPSTDVAGGDVNAPTVDVSIKQFNQGRNQAGQLDVVHASPSFIKGDISVGPKGKAGIEDPGLYVAPKGRANLGFTGLSSSNYGSGGVKIIDLGLDTPTISTISVGRVKRLPAGVVSEPGFAGPKRQAFNQANVGKGVAFITKRSQIGKGEISRQYFTPQETIKIGKLNRIRGKYYREAGTSESEAVILPGEQLVKSKTGVRDGFRYTIVNPISVSVFGKSFNIPFTGDLVRLPRYNLAASKAVPGKVGKASTRGRVLENVLKDESLSTDSYFKSKAKLPVRSFSLGRSKNEYSRSVARSAQSSQSRASVGSSSSSIGSGVSSVARSKPRRFGYSRSGRSSGYSGYSGASSSFSGQSSQVSLPSSNPPSRPSSSPPYQPTSKPPVKLDLNLKGAAGRLKIRDFSGKSKTRYTPSFTALLFNIRGTPKKTRLSKSGLDFRPIPKGYNITKGA